MNKATPIFLSLLLVACVSNEKVLEQNAQKLSLMTLDSVNTCTSVEGDEMTDLVTFSSYDCYHEVRGSFQSRRNDYFVRAVIAKDTGYTYYVVYAMLVGYEWSYPYSASYLTPQEDGERKLVRVDANRVTTDVDCSYGICEYDEHYTFPLEKSYLKALSDGYDELSQIDKEQKMRIFTRAGSDVDFVFNINELVGVYRKVEAHQIEN